MKNDVKSRPYLIDRRCGRCLVPLEIRERRAEGWLFVVYACERCDFRQTVTFSPAELAEWAQRSTVREARA